MTNASAKTPPKYATLYGVILALVAFFSFSVADATIKELGNRYHPTQILFFAQLFGCMFVTLCIGVRREPVALFPKQKLWVGIRCLAAAVTAGSFFYAFTVLPLAEIYVIVFAAPAITTLLAVPVLGERIGLWRTGALILGFVGVFIVLNPSNMSALGWGHVASVVGTFFASVSAIVVRRVRGVENPLTMTFYPCLAMFALGVVLMPFNFTPTLMLADIGFMALLGVFLVGANMLLVRAFSMAEASLLAPLQYSQMIWGVLFGMFIFNEQIPDSVYAGFPFIVASGLLIVWREAKLGRPTAKPVRE